MSCAVSRKFKISLSDDARRRATAHLISLGYREKQLQPIVWPEDAVSAYRRNIILPWEFTTNADLKRRRQERAKKILWWKREYGVIYRRPLYVWVFWCPGISGIFEGWWTYIIGRGVEHGGKYTQDSDLILRAMELFPMSESVLFGIEEDWQQRERWMKEFAKRYQRGVRCGKPQGKAPIWAKVEGNSIVKILGRAQWPPR